SCPLFWTEYEGHCYRYFPINKTWAEADLYCAEFSIGIRSAKLASIHRCVQAPQMCLNVLSMGSLWITLGNTTVFAAAPPLPSPGWGLASPLTFPQMRMLGGSMPVNGTNGSTCREMLPQWHRSWAALRSWNDNACGRAFPFVCKIPSLALD
ncbi:CL19A protein, partial [Erythrocercus mccallii]|nr:CL19A protein [Erythrocercus mccallii]